MSNSVYTSGNQSAYASLGTNGSLHTALALLFAGYGLTKSPGSNRVLGWVSPMKGCPPSEGGALYVLLSREDLAALVGNNADDCTWVELNDLLSKQLHTLPSELFVLVRVYLILHVLYSDVDSISAGLVKVSAPIIQQCVDQLSASCWYPKMQKFAEVFQVAAKNNQEVRFS